MRLTWVMCVYASQSIGGKTEPLANRLYYFVLLGSICKKARPIFFDIEAGQNKRHGDNWRLSVRLSIYVRASEVAGVYETTLLQAAARIGRSARYRREGAY